MPIPPKTVVNADTGTADLVGGNDWDDMVAHLANMNREPYTWYIYKDASNYKAKNGSTGIITYTNTDFKTLFQAIIDTIPTRDDTVRTKIKIGPGDFDVNTLITVANKYNLVIDGSGMGVTRIRAGATLAGVGAIWAFSGSVSGTTKVLTSNVALRSKTAVMSSGDASTFAVGDEVLLRSNVDFGTGGSASGHQGELKKIVSISSGTITFTEPVFDAYTTANGASMIKLLPSRNISITNLSVDRNPSYAPTLASSNEWFTWDFVNRVLVENVEVVDFPGQFGGSIAFRSCKEVKLNSCHLQQNVAYNWQYGFTFEQACQDCVISNCTAYGDMRHHFEAGDGRTGTNEEGVCRNIMFTGCTASGGSQNPFDTHPEGEGIHFINCSILGANIEGGIKLRSKRSSAKGCFVRNTSASGQGAIRVDDDGSDCTIEGCTVVDCGGDGIQIGNGVDGTMIIGNRLDNCAGYGIKTIIAGCFRTMISNNVIVGGDSDGINVSDFDNALITGNRISTNTGWGINFSAGNCTDNVITSNSFASNGSGAVNNGAQSGNREANNLGWT